MASPPKPDSVVIAGGSLAGLMHALTLLSLPKPPIVTILERSPTALLHNQGAGVVVGNETQQFFEEYVRPGRDIAVTSPMRHYLNKAGDVMPETVEQWTQRMTSWDLLYHLLRWRVDGLESEYTKGLEPDERPKAKYLNGSTVTCLRALDSGKVQVSYNHKESGAQVATADLVIAADGASSTVRKLLAPEVERKYVGYVAWRGACPETELSEDAAEKLKEKFTFFHSEGIQILGYLIPGENGTLKKGKRLFNWVWYCNYPSDSPELKELMTDVDGHRHALTLPVGKMNPEVWDKQRAYAQKVLPPPYAEAVPKTTQPFIQAITDVLSPSNSYEDGKVLLVGDALAGFRPHTAASTGQAAYDALTLGQWLRGELAGKEEYDRKIMEFARRLQEKGVMLGERSQFGKHPHNG